MRVCLIWLFGILFLSTSHAQQLEVGLQIGGSYYTGDLDLPSISDNIVNTNFASGLLAKYRWSNHFSFRGNLTFGKLSGDDGQSDLQWQLERNLSFTNNFTELAAMIEYDLFAFDPSSNDGNVFSLYALGGVAFLRHNPKTVYLGQTVALQALGTEGQGIEGFANKYSLNQITLPLGGGMKYAINDRVILGLELLGRITFTDHLDDIGGAYVAYDALRAGNGDLAANLGDRTGEFTGVFDAERRATGDVRGNGEIRDYYLSGMFTISYVLDGGFGGKDDLGCPSF